MNKELLGFLLFVVVGIVAVSGCTSMNTGANTVTIQNLTFSPSTLNVQVGTTVTG